MWQIVNKQHQNGKSIFLPMLYIIREAGAGGSAGAWPAPCEHTHALGAAPLRARAQVHGRAQESAYGGRGAGSCRSSSSKAWQALFGVKAQSSILMK